MPVSEGSIAPEFSLLDENGDKHNLSEYRGNPLILYFYPKDDTPGCTKEACNFRDDYSAYQAGNVEIVGVSPDSPIKHAKFKTKYNLPFTLLSDEGHKVSELFGVWGPKKFMGRVYDGVQRTTFLLDEHGKIKHVFEKVRPAEHSAAILEIIETWEIKQ